MIESCTKYAITEFYYDNNETFKLILFYNLEIVIVY